MRKIITKKNREDIEPLNNLIRQIDAGSARIHVGGLKGASRSLENLLIAIDNVGAFESLNDLATECETIIARKSY